MSDKDVPAGTTVHAASIGWFARCAVVAALLAGLLAGPAMAENYFADAQGRFFLTALVNNVPIRFQVDTGADSVTLSLRDSRAAGITRNDIIGMGSAKLASGAVVQTAIVRLRDFRIGRSLLPNGQATVILRATVPRS
jgi:clan AA aspartic protease (TIGR02281 family)